METSRNTNTNANVNVIGSIDTGAPVARVSESSYWSALKKHTYVLLSLFVICAVVLAVYYYWRWCKLRGVYIKQYEKALSTTRVQSGDLCLARFLGSNCTANGELLSRMSGPSWSHVGLFHRDIETNKLALFEFSGNDGMQYSTIENRMEYYAGHMAVRHLRTPLTRVQVVALQQVVDVAMLRENRVGDSVEVSTFRSDRRRVVNFDSRLPLVDYDYHATQASAFLDACGLTRLHPVSAICTDFVRTLLERIDVLPTESISATSAADDTDAFLVKERSTCLHPDFFVNDSRINAAYGRVRALKDFHTQHDNSINHCIFDGSRKVRWSKEVEDAVVAVHGASGCGGDESPGNDTDGVQRAA